MEQEMFFTGYCRCLDQSRMVEVIAVDGKPTEIDCNYGNCPHVGNCTIAQQIDAL